MRLPTLAVIACLAIVSAGCSLKMWRVHRVTVQQGNVITQQMIDRLKPGMTKSQVAFVMGEPVLRNAFDEDRWDYVYTLDIPGYYGENKQISLFFKNGVLAYFTGDYAPSSTKVDETSSTKVDETSSTKSDETSSTKSDETSSAKSDETSSAKVDETSSATADGASPPPVPQATAPAAGRDASAGDGARGG